MNEERHVIGGLALARFSSSGYGFREIERVRQRSPVHHSRGVPCSPSDEIFTRNGRGSSARLASMPVLAVSAGGAQLERRPARTLATTAHKSRERLPVGLRGKSDFPLLSETWNAPDDVASRALGDAQVVRLRLPTIC